MKQRLRRLPKIGLAALLNIFLFTSVGLFQSSHGQTSSDQATELRHSTEFWEDAIKNNRVLLVPLPDSWSNQAKKRYIDNRTNPNYRGHYVQDPKSRRYYVPMDRDGYLKNREEELMKKRASRAQIEQMKRGYDSESRRMKQYVAAQRLPKARQDLAKLQPPVPKPPASQPPAPPPPAPAAKPEEIRKALNALTDSMVRKWKGELEETIRIAQDDGPVKELAGLDYWATNHLKTITMQVAIRTAAHQQAYRDYLDCLDREVYCSHLPTSQQIIDTKRACKEELDSTWRSIP